MQTPQDLNELLKKVNLQKFPPYRFDLDERERSILQSKEVQDIQFSNRPKKGEEPDDQLQLI